MTIEEALKKYHDNKTMLRRGTGIAYSVGFLRSIKKDSEIINSRCLNIPRSFDYLLNDNTWELDNEPP